MGRLKAVSIMSKSLFTRIRLSKKIRPWLWRWHRRTGVAAVMVMLIVAVTGILLNHTDTLALAKRSVDQNWLLALYGIDTPTYTSFDLNGQWLSGDEKQQLYRNDEYLTECRGSLKGVALLEAGFTVACEQELIIFDDQGEALDRVSAVYGLPVPILQIGYCEQALCVATAERVFRFDALQLSFQPLLDVDVTWSQSGLLPAVIKASLLSKHQGLGLTWERVLLDLHSGRLFGHAGVWLFDLAALLLMFLSISGFVLWYQHYVRKK